VYILTLIITIQK